MEAAAPTIDRRAAVALLEWWAESGVDIALANDPRDWRNATRPAVSKTAGATPEATAPIPADFASFRSWLETAEGLPFDIPGARRVLPIGRPGADIMLLSDISSLDDRGQPIGGDSWALAVRMLTAIGIDSDNAYVANLSCFSSPTARLAGDELERCGEIARAHIALAAPKRLVLFGDAAARALVGGPVAQKRGKIHKVEGVRTITTFAPSWLLKRPADKAHAWRDLLLLMESE